MVHVVYCDPKEKELTNILNGQKKMVIRGAAGRKIPHSRVHKGETLFFMEKGTAKITVKAVVQAVFNYTKLSDDEIVDILALHQQKLKLSENQQNRWHKKCLIIIEFMQVEKLEPLVFEHQGNMDDWLIIEKIEDVLEGTSIPYNYKLSKFK